MKLVLFSAYRPCAVPSITKFASPFVALFLWQTCMADEGVHRELTTNIALCHQPILRHRADERDATTYDVKLSNHEAIMRRAQSCKAALHERRNDAEALNNIGIGILDNGAFPLTQDQAELAESLFTQAIAIQPDYQDAISNLADTYFAQGKATSAIALVESNVSHNPDNPIAWGLLGSALHTDGQFDRAILAFQKAVAIDPSFSTGWQAMSFEYLSLGKWEEAIQAANKAVEINPKYTGAWIDLKLAFQGAKRTSDARRAAEKIRELAPESRQAQLNK